MIRRSTRPVLPLAAFLVTTLALGCASLPGEAQRTTDRATLRYALAGTGAPVVVFESGLGNGMESWREVFEPVAGFTRAIAYDRVGYGRSESDAATRDGATIVEELRALLRSLDLTPPFVLVGHSLGGQFVEMFARLHPEEVAGVVLVDARHSEFSTRCIEQNVERCEMAWFQSLFMPAAARRELAAAAATEQQLREAPSFPDIPLRVLTATRRPASMPRLRRVWAASQADLSRLSPQGIQDICHTCGHFIQYEEPERVIGAIRELVEGR